METLTTLVNILGPFPAVFLCEPITDPGEKSADNSGFYMPFSAKAMIIQKDVQVVRDLLDRAADIVFGSIPAVNESCKDCMALESIKAA